MPFRVGCRAVALGPASCQRPTMAIPCLADVPAPTVWLAAYPCHCLAGMRRLPVSLRKRDANAAAGHPARLLGDMAQGATGEAQTGCSLGTACWYPGVPHLVLVSQPLSLAYGHPAIRSWWTDPNTEGQAAWEQSDASLAGASGAQRPDPGHEPPASCSAAARARRDRPSGPQGTSACMPTDLRTMSSPRRLQWRCQGQGFQRRPYTVPRHHRHDREQAQVTKGKSSSKGQRNPDP